MDNPRDYRDQADIDEALDIIRTAHRDEAAQLYRVTLDCAYHQGRAEGAGRMLRHAKGVFGRLAADIVTDIAAVGDPSEGEQS
jgi:hypothetical protein